MNFHEIDEERPSRLHDLQAPPGPELDAALQEVHARLRTQQRATYRLAEVMTERAVGASGVSYFARNWLIGVIRDVLTHEFSDADVRALEATL